MKKLVILFVLVGTLSAQQNSKDNCDPNDRSTWEWVFHFPQKKQKGQVLSLQRDGLSNLDNINPQYREWLAQKSSIILTGLLADETQELSGLTIRLDCVGMAQVETVEATVEQEVYDGKRGRASRLRKVAVSVLTPAVIAVSFLVPGAGYPAFMGAGIASRWLNPRQGMASGPEQVAMAQTRSNPSRRRGGPLELKGQWWKEW